MTTHPTLPYVRGSQTSQEAAESMRPHAPTIRHRVFRYILEQGELGATDSQIETALALRHQTASARRRELELMGAVYRSKMCRRTGSGRMAGVYVGIPGVNIDKPRGIKPKSSGGPRHKRVNIHLTQAEHAALCELAAGAGVDTGAMARALMIHGYQLKQGMNAAQVML